MLKNKILIIGASGLLGNQAFNYFIEKPFELFTIFNTHKLFNKNSYKVDIFEVKNLYNCLSSISPDIILNCAGLTNVELCEKENEKAEYLHVKFPQYLAEYTFLNKILNIHISTDHLWDGNKSFYVEDDKPCPLNFYGETKALGEKAVLTANPNSIVIRTNFFGNGTEWRKSFSDWVIEKLRNNDNFIGFDDVFYSPISIPFLLDAIYKLINTDYSGIIHIAGAERISKYDFIVKMAKVLNLDHNYLVRAKYSQQENKIPRPLDMSLNINKIESVLNIQMPNVEESIWSIL